MSPTFGQVLRGARLGYHWSAKHQAMVRVAGDGPFQIWLCPPGQLPSAPTKGEFRVWWEKPEILDACPALAGIKRVKQPIQITVGERGELLEERRAARSGEM